MGPPLPPGFRYETPEVIYPETAGRGFVTAGAGEVALLKRLAPSTARKRCRLCAHPAPDATQQEMLIVMRGDSYVRPHRHRDKSETLTVLEGAADALIFDEAGTVIEVIHMAPYAEGGRFFYRMPAGLFHGLVFRSNWLVYLETTCGPFDPAASEAAPWAPAEGDAGAVDYRAQLVAAAVR